MLGESAAQLYEIALAASLAEYPMIRCALGLLSLLAGPVEYQFFDATLRSPYLGFQAGEMARFLRRIRAQAHREVSPEEFFGWLRGSELSGLREAVERLPAHAPFASQQPVEHWSAFAEEALKGFGWPKGVALNSEEFQCLESWNELFASVASLEALGWRTDFAGFVARLERAAAARRFKPESLGTPVQIMDVAEAEGSTFDALWIGGSSDEQWPALSALSPLLPTGMQKAAGVPTEGTAHGEERVRRITARLLSSAPRIVLSLARRCEDEREQRWSPLFTKIPMTHAGEVAAASLAARFAPATLESMEDAAAPALADGEKIHGGTSLLEEQSGCPFRAFAIRRLHAPRAEGPHEPLEATLRGKIIELAMELIWRELGDSDGLGRSDLEQVIERSVKRATAKLAGESQDPWKRQLFEVERKRTTDVIGRWLSVERRRRPFRVLAHQQNVGVELAGLRLAGKIDRLDEMGGEQVVIDYKTGKAIGLGSWSVPRPLHPQLPFYALAKRREGANIAGIAFASIRCDEQCFRGYLRDKDLLPIFRDGARRYFDGAGFDDYLPRWEEELERLARSFAAGDAAVDPRLPPVNSNSPCRRCHLQALCRIGDLPPNSDEEESGEAGDE